MYPQKNRNNPSVTSDTVKGTPEKRGHPSTSSSSSGSPNSTPVRPTKLLKDSEGSKIKPTMGLSDQDLAKIKAIMNQLLDEKLEPIKQQQRDISQRITRLDKFSRDKNIIISGLEEQGDDLESSIEAVNNLCEKVGIQQVLIDDVFRIGKKGSGDRPILLKLALKVDKKRLMKAAKSLRKEKIYLNDDQSQEERIVDGKLRAHFKSMKATKPDISFSIRNGVMQIWSNSIVIENFHVDDGVVKTFSPLSA